MTIDREKGKSPEMEGRIRVSVPGKIIISGEHAVVYGNPAIIAAIGKRCRVNISPIKESIIKIKSRGYGDERLFSTSEVLEFTNRARELWKQFFKTKDKKFLQEINKEPFSVVLIAVGETLSRLEKKNGGLRINIVSSIPAQSGLGSSAAVSVGVISGILQSCGKVQASLADINSIAYEVEKCQHGLPSGGDNSTVTFGGLVRFQKEGDQFRISPIERSSFFELPPFVLIQSGRPVETTGEMVGLIRQKYEGDPAKTGGIFTRIGDITEGLLEVLQKQRFEKLPSQIRTNERLLEELGVVGEAAKETIRGIEKIGGVAKVCGAGGLQEGSGILLALHEEPEILVRFAKENNLESFFPVRLGVKGVSWRRRE